MFFIDVLGMYDNVYSNKVRTRTIHYKLMYLYSLYK